MTKNFPWDGKNTGEKRGLSSDNPKGGWDQWRYLELVEELVLVGGRGGSQGPMRAVRGSPMRPSFPSEASILFPPEEPPDLEVPAIDGNW